MLNLGSILRTTITVLVVTAAPGTVFAQDIPTQLLELQRAVETLRSELAEARRDADDVRRELNALRQEVGARVTVEDHELLGAKVDELEQTKVESGSKYHMRLSGLALLQTAVTQGEVDSADLPSVARPALGGEGGGALTAGARQSYLRFEVFGPRVGGATSSAEATLDFFGGFPITTEGFTTGFARLRTAALTFDWPRMRIVAGHATPFFSPASPTSLVQSAYPAMWAAGNMWSWVPQAHVEHRLTRDSAGVVLQGGVLDPLTGELPASEYDRVPTAGERTRRPALAARVAWQPARDTAGPTVGAGTYYSPQHWGFGRDLNAWAATADWDVHVGRGVSFSGELYKGVAIAGLGASAAPSVAFAGPRDNSTSAVLPFGSTGGWSQLKIAPAATLEFNVAAGTDRSRPNGAASLLSSGLLDPGTVHRNTTAFVNGIYTVRSNLLLSLEYRRLHTRTLAGATPSAGHLSFGAGLGF
jgi:hypothetical protein